MTAETEMFNALPKAFRIALLVTGSTEAAETAVLDGIAALEPDNISADSLLFETVKSATERHADFPGEFEEAFSILPLELLRVRLLASNLRRAIERLVVQPLSNLMATGQIQCQDRIRITHGDASPSLTFFRETGAWETWKTNGMAAA